MCIRDSYLTGVYNRNYLEETVNQWLHNDDASQVLTCLALDIDNFKAIDQCVIRLADVVFPYGQDHVNHAI